MPHTTAATTSYLIWKAPFVKELDKNNNGSRFGYLNYYHTKLLLENFEKIYANQLSYLQVNTQLFKDLINEYSSKLCEVYGYEWEEAAQSTPSNAIFLEFIDEIKKNGVLSYNKEIKKMAPIILQQGRTIPNGFFTNLPTDYFYELANYLEPQRSKEDAAQTMKDELQKADDFYHGMQFFSFEEENILFSAHSGTQVILNPQDSFKNWFAALPLRENTVLNDKYGLYKVNDDTLAINSGPNTPGIQIRKKDDAFIVCNNLTADKNNANMMSEQLMVARKNNLVTILSELNTALHSDFTMDDSSFTQSGLKGWCLL